MLRIEFRAMGSQIAAFLDHESPQSVQALEQVPAWFEEWEGILSRFRPHSELNQLNAMAGRPLRTSPTLFSVLRASLQAAHWSSGRVVPTILDSLERAGYDRSFDQLQTAATGSLAEPSSIVSLVAGRFFTDDWRSILMDASSRTVTLPPGMRLDFGGIGKGWAAQQAVERLKSFGPALVDAGGDIAVSGPRMDGCPWSIAVTNPLSDAENLDTLALKTGAVATSGIDYHRWLQNGTWQHHIIDPSTGEPATTDLLSATVIAPDLLQAEAAAKVGIILGSKNGSTWLESQSDMAGLLVLQNGTVIRTSQLQKFLMEIAHAQ